MGENRTASNTFLIFPSLLHFASPRFFFFFSHPPTLPPLPSSSPRCPLSACLCLGCDCEGSLPALFHTRSPACVWETETRTTITESFYEWKSMKIRKKAAMKVLNVSRCVDGFPTVCVSECKTVCILVHVCVCALQSSVPGLSNESVRRC